jgi:hypothetical protein
MGGASRSGGTSATAAALRAVTRKATPASRPGRKPTGWAGSRVNVLTTALDELAGGAATWPPPARHLDVGPGEYG